MVANLTQEENVNIAFTRQSASFDDVYESNPITLLMRQRVRSEVLKHIQPGAHLLELNCGTGIDSIFFAQKGYNVLATDNADGMLHQLAAKVRAFELQERITIRKCSFNDLSPLAGGHYDYIFSNFGGLNCTNDLAAVLEQVDGLLQPGGYFTFVVMPVICPWEISMAVKGRIKTAFRRWRRKDANAHIEGVHFNCYYYNPSFIISRLKHNYELCSLQGMASLMPPPFMDYFPVKYPKLFSTLEKLEYRVCRLFPFNRWCDQYMITMRKCTG